MYLLKGTTHFEPTGSWRCSGVVGTGRVVMSISICRASCHAPLYLERSISVAGCGRVSTSAGRQHDMHTYLLYILSSHRDRGILCGHACTTRDIPRLFPLVLCRNHRVRDLGVKPYPMFCRLFTLQALALTPGPALHCRGEISAEGVQVVHCPRRQDREGITSVPLIGVRS